ncbi:hypothetical protein HKW67_00380 [Gemmatimonas groenlandica]|uniref:Uncharacterized protein n=2 Tax=Gemmatimonas groenlandica TaxID=2732249 RepID=A0A6M4IL33_9BACT|nr:hypothetical protein [Gemmatimonas groenlandica]QJR34076.1 hypothetical protein HKW67_00380 [Gemmatimonas groenlandica]
MRRLSMVGRGDHTDEQVLGYYNTGDHVTFGGKQGASWGTLNGILFDSALLFVPLLCHIIVLGPLVGALANGAAGPAFTGGLTALGVALHGIGIPKHSAMRYETAVHADRHLLVAHGPGADVRRARTSLAETGAERLDMHAAARLNDPGS